MPDADETTGGSVAPTPIGDPFSTEPAAPAESTVDAEEPTAPEDSSGEQPEPSSNDGETTGASSEPVPERVYDLDPILAASEAHARAALTEITTEDTIGPLVATLAQGEHVVSLQFANLMRGYPGWLWTATLSRIDETEDVNILEVELLPGEGAVLAPDWVPWSVRLADYHAAQESGEEASDETDDELDEDADDDSDDDDDDSDEDDSDEDDEDSDDDDDESDDDDDDESDDDDDDESDDDDDDESDDDDDSDPDDEDDDESDQR